MSKAPSHESVELEHEFAGIIRAMEDHGFHFDETKAMALLAKLQKRKAELEGKLQSAFHLGKLKNVYSEGEQ